VLRAAEQIADLELRDPGGKPVPLESILVSDLEELVAVGASMRGIPAGRQHEGDPVRYVISATFAERGGAFGRGRRAH
jgi:hypothetical protein